MFVAYRVATQLLSDTGSAEGAKLVSYLWMGFCIYTWVGPKMFRDAVTKELGKVQLRDDF
jgi:hypothetical protein